MGAHRKRSWSERLPLIVTKMAGRCHGADLAYRLSPHLLFGRDWAMAIGVQAYVRMERTFAERGGGISSSG